MRIPEGPTMPEGPETPKAQEGLQGIREALVQPAAPGPSHIDKPMGMEEVKLLVDQVIDLDVTIPANLPEDPADVVILDDDEPSFTDSYPEAISTPIIETASDRKRSSEDTSPSTSPPKRQATEEMVDPAPPEASLPKGTTEKDLLPKRYEVFASDYVSMQGVRGSILGLEAGDSPSKGQIEHSSNFRLRTAASEMGPPEVIAEHWLDHLRSKGVLVECPPDQFTTPADWILLYTSESLQRYLPTALSAFPNQGVPSLIAVAPPECHVGSNKEFLLCNFY